MPKLRRLAKENVVHRYTLDNGELLIIEAKQVDGAGQLTRENYLTASFGVDRDQTEFLYKAKGPLERTGVETCLSLVSTNLTDMDGNPFLEPDQPIPMFLNVWASPSLGEVALTVGPDRQYTYRDLIHAAVLEANPQWDTQLFRAPPPQTADVPDKVSAKKSD